MFHVRAIRRFLAAGDGDVTVLRERKKRRFTGKQNRRCPIWRKPDETWPGQIECLDCVAGAAVQMNFKKHQPRISRKEKMFLRILSFVQDLDRVIEAVNVCDSHFESG